MSVSLSSGHICQIFEELDSTNLEAKRQLTKPISRPKWILAIRQTNGYGRYDRKWTQTSGEFAGTVLLPLAPQTDFAKLPLISFATALAVRETITSFCPHAMVQMKWPNDVLIEKGKASGLLLEMCEAQGCKILIIGVGINIHNAPHVAEYKTSKLSDFIEHRPCPSPQDLLQVLDSALFTKIDTLISDGFLPLRQEWLSHAFGIGEKIQITLPNERIEGTFEGIDEEGALILREDLAIRRINSADVFFPQLAL